MAGLYQLPVLFVCENNGYGEYTAQANHQAIVDVADRAAGYGMPGVIVDGMDAVAVHEAAGVAIQRARDGGGPTLLECKTYRFYDHVGVRGMGLKYRSDDEVEEWKRRDPDHPAGRSARRAGHPGRKLKRKPCTRKWRLISRPRWSLPRTHPTRSRKRSSKTFTRNSQGEAKMAEAAEKPRTLPYVAAITDGVRQILKEQDNAFVAGEDVAGAGSVYGYYNGLLEEFGPNRVFDTPISEEGIVGLGVGAAATGCRPIIDLMFMDFLGECMDEVANQLAKMRYMFGGRATLPVTMLTMAGAGASLAAQHSQSLEAWLCHLPGLKVAMPTTPYDAKGLIIAAAGTTTR